MQAQKFYTNPPESQSDRKGQFSDNVLEALVFILNIVLASLGLKEKNVSNM